MTHCPSAARPPPGVRARSGRSRAAARSVLVIGVALGFLFLLGPVGPRTSHSGPPHELPREVTLRETLPVGRIGHLPAALPRPQASNEFYTQIGATLSEVNNTFAIGGLTHLAESIPLVVSPYPTGYELNLLSDTGDWYQVVIGDNWPGCNSGFEEIIEVWDSQGGSGPVTCDPAVSLAKGNVIVLNGSLPSRTNACLGLDDLTTHRSHVVCQAQPDAGGSEFIFLGSAANGDGYYTGTMTEIVNLSATSCPDYRLIPTVTFDFPPWAHFTEFVPWSDEWDNVPSGVFCYSSSGPVVYLPGPSPQSHYEDATGGATDGPQEIQGQNDTTLNASVGFRFQSDPRPIASETLNASATHVSAGGTVTLQSSTTGGRAPYGTLWEFDGSFTSGQTGSDWNFSTLTPGNYSFVAFGTDAQGNALGSPKVTIVVPFPLTVGPLTASTGGGADAGQSVTFSARATGGLLPLSFAWTGLPAGCASSNGSSLTCVPTVAGTSTVALTATDANGSQRQANGLAFTVSPTLSVALVASRTVGDVGQSVLYRAVPTGGSGGLGFIWSQLPGGCASTSMQAACALRTTGESVVTVAASDTNRMTATSPSSVLWVFPTMTSRLSVSSSGIDLDHPVTFSATVVGGAGGAHFDWNGLPGGCTSADTATLSCTPSNASTFSVGATVADRANASVPAAPVDLLVYPALTLSLSPSTRDAVAPASLSISPTVLGGSGLVNISWLTLPTGCLAQGLHPVVCTALDIGNYTVKLRVDDVGHGNATAQLHFSVGSPASPGPTPLSEVPGGEPLLFGIVLVLIVAAAIGLALRRRSRASPPR
ncbi:MAG: hypothetical protein L3J95_02500 [Thermoplasmata archaeon]|nr:hypothetical protein [Thermoplasmata archaeon]MCI4359277.1 hypothetical protein [Thermoplasmata archaeon]